MKVLTDDIIALAQSQNNGDDVLLYDFIRVFYSNSSYKDLHKRSIQSLLGMAISTFNVMQESTLLNASIRVFNPVLDRDGWDLQHTVLIASSIDMPFLVDSVRLALNSLNLNVHLAIHVGGMEVTRDRENIITAIDSYRHTSSAIESPIYFEFDRRIDQSVLDEIKNKVSATLVDVSNVVNDWKPMCQRLEQSIDQINQSTAPLKPKDKKESIAFLEWLLQDHFIFFGARDYEVKKVDGELMLKLVNNSGLGVLSVEINSCQLRKFSELSDVASKFMMSSDNVLVISKTNTLSTVHRYGYTDYIAIKLFDDNGQLVGERRFIGLYTSSAYNTNPTNIPFLRKKIALVLKRAALPEKSHAGKDLAHILLTIPRDDLIQANVEELFHLSMGIMFLQERRQIRLFVREDSFGRFFSCLVYIPRENFNTDLLKRFENILMKVFDGIECLFSTDFSASILARIHYTIRVKTPKKRRYKYDQIEELLVQAGKTWDDRLAESMVEYHGEFVANQLLSQYADAFPLSYQERFTSMVAVNDIIQFEKIKEESMLAIKLYHLGASNDELFMLKLFHLNTMVPLAQAFPILENMGVMIIGENSFNIICKDGRSFWVNDFEMNYQNQQKPMSNEVKVLFEEAFFRIWSGRVENDTLNRLVLSASLDWQQITIFRSYAKYLQQIDFTFSQEYIAETLVTYPKITQMLFELFDGLFNPYKTRDTLQCDKLEQAIIGALDDVTILDQDRIFRTFLNLIKATLRTNYFQKSYQELLVDYLVFKLDPSLILDFPLPRPRYELFVYSPEFEGVHLRMGKVARGGLRWSDRREDFRTEILGLMKAQQVKNAIIVPDGAKGGFVIKAIPPKASRGEMLDLGKMYYKRFISGLLDLTDNLVRDEVVRPDNTVCYDDADVYFVVAADKGTATFSDIANEIAIKRQFWLGDAFASGGSDGFDHKKMGITARGAWVSGERHFQDLGINLAETEVTVVGIGDMGGDVFGNGLLLSNKLKLIAAFNHQHIFLDPNPDVETSYEERKRLFAAPRGGWDDYNKDLISKGGGVYLRSSKSIALSPEIKEVLSIDVDSIVPAHLMTAILKADVDLLWNGGIGTFVKSASEVNELVGDPGNDSIRINGSDLKASVVCEGGNLGLTQLGRIEYSNSGGNINADFIDNSAGVDCSDHEVNIKILLNSIMAEGLLTLKQRNSLLVKMTDEVMNLVLQNNYKQNKILSLLCSVSVQNLPMLAEYLGFLESAGKIDRALEFLPTEEELQSRVTRKQGLARPELAVLLEYSNITLAEELMQASIADDSLIRLTVKKAFPTLLRKKYSEFMFNHRLFKQIVMTQLSNRIVAEMGVTFIYQMQQEQNASSADIVKAYMAAVDIFDLHDLNAVIESLDFIVDSEVQYGLYLSVIRLMRQAVRWLLRNKDITEDLQQLIQMYRPSVGVLFKKISKLLGGDLKTDFNNKCEQFVESGLDPEVAQRMASMTPMYHALNIIEISMQVEFSIPKVATAYFLLIDRLHLQWLRQKINLLPMDSHWLLLAKSNLKVSLDAIQRDLTLKVLSSADANEKVSACVTSWMARMEGDLMTWNKLILETHSNIEPDYAILSVAIKELTEILSK